MYVYVCVCVCVCLFRPFDLRNYKIILVIVSIVIHMVSAYSILIPFAAVACELFQVFLQSALWYDGINQQVNNYYIYTTQELMRKQVCSTVWKHFGFPSKDGGIIVEGMKCIVNSAINTVAVLHLYFYFYTCISLYFFYPIFYIYIILICFPN